MKGFCKIATIGWTDSLRIRCVVFIHAPRSFKPTPMQFKDLRAARHLLYHNSRYQAKIQKRDTRITDVEHDCSVLKQELEKEREEIAKLEKELAEEQEIAAKWEEEQHLATTKCGDLEKLLDEERAISSAKYTELECTAFEERDRFALLEKELEEDKARLKAECDDWRT